MQATDFWFSCVSVLCYLLWLYLSSSDCLKDPQNFYAEGGGVGDEVLEGGKAGGMVVAEGTPEEVAQNPASHTGRFLAEVLAK